MRRSLLVMGCLVALSASPTLACSHQRYGAINYRSETQDVEACLDLMDGSVDKISKAMDDIVDTRKILEVKTNHAAACGWASEVILVLHKWAKAPRPRPFVVNTDTSVSEIIARTNAQVEIDKKWGLVDRTITKIANDCPAASPE